MAEPVLRAEGLPARRSTPPSVRFWAVACRVYAEVVVLLAIVAAPATERGRALQEVMGVPAHTVRRWSARWRTTFFGERIRPVGEVRERPDGSAVARD